MNVRTNKNRTLKWKKKNLSAYNDHNAKYYPYPNLSFICLTYIPVSRYNESSAIKSTQKGELPGPTAQIDLIEKHFPAKTFICYLEKLSSSSLYTLLVIDLLYGKDSIFSLIHSKKYQQHVLEKIRMYQLIWCDQIGSQHVWLQLNLSGCSIHLLYLPSVLPLFELFCYLSKISGP